MFNIRLDVNRIESLANMLVCAGGATAVYAPTTPCRLLKRSANYNLAVKIFSKV